MIICELVIPIVYIINTQHNNKIENSITIPYYIKNNMCFHEYEPLTNKQLFYNQIDGVVDSVVDDVHTKTLDEPTTVKTHLGTFRLTVYTQHSVYGYATATGQRSQHLQTCAVDPKIIPYGSTIIIGDLKTGLKLKAVDCGNFKGKHVDIFYEGTDRESLKWLLSTYGDYNDVWIET